MSFHCCEVDRNQIKRIWWTSGRPGFLDSKGGFSEGKCGCQRGSRFNPTWRRRKLGSPQKPRFVFINERLYPEHGAREGKHAEHINEKPKRTRFLPSQTAATWAAVEVLPEPSVAGCSCLNIAESAHTHTHTHYCHKYPTGDHHIGHKPNPTLCRASCVVSGSLW